MTTFCTIWTINPRGEVVSLEYVKSDAAVTKLAMWRAMLPDNELHLDLGKDRGAAEVVYATKQRIV